MCRGNAIHVSCLFKRNRKVFFDFELKKRNQNFSPLNNKWDQNRWRRLSMCLPVVSETHREAIEPGLDSSHLAPLQNLEVLYHSFSAWRTCSSFFPPGSTSQSTCCSYFLRYTPGYASRPGSAPWGQPSGKNSVFVTDVFLRQSENNYGCSEK